VDHEQTSARGDEKKSLNIPHDPTHEHALIAACCVSRECRRKYTQIYPPEWFYGEDPDDARIWAALGELDRRGLDYDPATLRKLAPDVDTEFLDRLIAARPEVPPNIAQFAADLEYEHTRVEVARGPLSALVDEVKKKAGNRERVRALAEQVATGFERGGDKRFLSDPTDLVNRVLANIDKRRKGQSCWDYGVPGLDYDLETNVRRTTPGAAPGQVTLIVGLSGGGKSTGTNQIAVAQALAGRRVLNGAFEMGDEDTLELCATLSAGADRGRTTLGELSDTETEQVKQAVRDCGSRIRFMRNPFGVEPGKWGKNQRNLDLLHRYVADGAWDVAIFDLFSYAIEEPEPAEETIALRRIQSIAQSTRTHVILVHQLTLKDVEKRPDKRPTRESIKGSSGWVEVPDTIFGIHRQAIWKDVPDDKVEWICLKQRRAAWPWCVEFDYDPKVGLALNGKGVKYVRPGEQSDADIAFKRETEGLRRRGGGGISSGKKT
jgi:hypothetical protein